MATRFHCFGYSFLFCSFVFLPLDGYGRESPSNALQKSHPTRILAKFAHPSSASKTSLVLDELGLVVKHEYQLMSGLVTLDRKRVTVKSLDPGLTPKADGLKIGEIIEKLKRSGLFDYVEPDFIQRIHQQPSDLFFATDSLWGLRNSGSGDGLANADVDAVAAWDLSTGSEKVIVAVIDTGIRYTHQDLNRQMWQNPGEIDGNGIDDDRDGFVDNLYGLNASGNSGDPFDDNDHGTHLAGTIGAAANDGYPHVGVSWNVRLMACKFLDPDGFGFTSDAIRCIEFAVTHGARIINLSWGGSPFSQSLYDSIEAAGTAGVLCVTSAGNESSNVDAVASYPGAFQLLNVISVTALDRRDRLGGFANVGNRNVHLGAPGVDILSTTAVSDSSYGKMNGTSMAAAHVTGVAALLLGRNGSMPLPELRARLLGGAVRVPSLEGKVETGGRLNAFRSLTAEPDGVIEVAIAPTDGSELAAGQIARILLAVSDIQGITNAVISARHEESNQTIAFRRGSDLSGSDGGDGIYLCDLRVADNPGPVTLILEVNAPGKSALFRTVRYNVVIPPENDSFEKAAVIASEGGIVLGNNRFASIEEGEPLHAGVASRAASVWWTWQPVRSGPVVIDTAGSALDTVLAVYSDNRLESLQAVAAADDAVEKKQGYVQFDAEAGTRYAIVVAGFSIRDTGAIRLRVEFEGGPDRESPELRITAPLSGISVTDAGDRTVVVTGTAWDPLPNASGVSEVLVQVNGNLARPAYGTTEWASTNVLEIGENNIRVVATDAAGNVSRQHSVTVLFRPRHAPNDLFANAAELTGYEGSVTVNSEGATREFMEPWHGDVQGGASVWWHFQPSEDGVLRLTTAGSDFDTTLGVYQGDRVTNLVAIAGNDNSGTKSTTSQIESVVRAFQSVWIAVDGHSNSGGFVKLNFQFEPRVIHTVTVNPTLGGVGIPQIAAFAKSSKVEIVAVPDAGYYFDRWEGAIRSLENPLRFVIRDDVAISAVFLPEELSDGFETGGFDRLEWMFSESAPWSVQAQHSFSGAFVARSGIVQDGQSSSMALLADCRSGQASFRLKVSSEKDWDVLAFFVNEKRLGQWSGEVGWQRFEFEVMEGRNRFEWRYTKDPGGFSKGLDSAFVDDVVLPLTVAVDETTPAHLTVTVEENRSVRIDLLGQPGQRYVIQSTDTLMQWMPVSTNIARNGIVHFVESASSGSVRKFYRAAAR